MNSLFRERATRDRKEPLRSLSQPKKICQNSRSLWFTWGPELTASSFSEPEFRFAAREADETPERIGAALAPMIAGVLLADLQWSGTIFVVAGVLKLIYDGLLYVLFRKALPPEEARSPN